MKQFGVVDTETDVEEWKAAAEERDAKKAMTFEEAVERIIAAGFTCVLGRDDNGTWTAALKRIGDPYPRGPDVSGAATPAHALMAALERHK